jgi:hypothetical protein
MKKLAKVGATLATAAALTLGGTALASASGTYGLHAGTDYAHAWTSTSGGTQGWSYAQHGGYVASTGWTTRSSSAHADCGTSWSYRAQVWFR